MIWKTPEIIAHLSGLFTLAPGDLIIGDKDGTGCLNRFYWDEGMIQEAFKMLNEIICPRIICPGHGDIIAADENAFRKVRSFNVSKEARV